ncbi:DUF3575 domain-containing protein [Flavobacterium agrisoli]|uniref:DUF3575 domain-containing protein n=1 Tax=Flavobacterium agrisoli TaxID=2793066 RepID=A0A934PLA9_9FLAO|nr:DUF3575 domain-containing protein [Flavobacterium agrisoli]MBK0369429.1 DUF3575 domain-containing protein [Flavobacterium agrisoli]
MKKITFITLFLLFVSPVFCQTSEVTIAKKNELKLNAAFLLGGVFEASYERILSEESAFGASIYIPLETDYDQYTKFNLTPYYRYYFGKKVAAGFFFEGFGSLNTYQDYFYNENSNIEHVTNTDFALGFGIGSKWITKKGFLFEINGGLGRNLFNSKDTDYQLVGRGGISVGYRF